MTSDFSMIIEDVFSIEGAGTMVSGKVQSGTVKIYDKAEISGIHPTRKVKIADIRTSSGRIKEAHAGDTVSLVLVKAGMFQAKIDVTQIAVQEIVRARLT